MFTSEELYEACRRVLLESPDTLYLDAHYFSGTVPTGGFKLSNYLDVFATSFRQQEDQEPQRLGFLREGTSCFDIAVQELPAVLVVRPRDLGESLKVTFAERMPSGHDPEKAVVFVGLRFVEDPSTVPWLTEVYGELTSLPH